MMLAWLLLGFRCPRCRQNLGWRIVTTHSHRDSIFKMLTLQECPTCAFRGRRS
jgi:hypothetical protein